PEIMVEHVNVEDYDALAIPGGFEEAGFYEDAYHESFQRLIQDFNDKEKLFASVCVGALPIGKSGILLGRKATTYHLNGGIGKRQRQLAAFGVDVQDKHVVMDGNVITSSSPATALEVAFLLLEKLTSVENCRKVKEGMGFGGR
ncbi:MAG TPA: DJ-1/PfpI family protein, partial [Alphaproteobacteria bacterium]|nr:DJ-1/PfpI family protein [Alphaproteobacteria bacterium]